MKHSAKPVEVQSARQAPDQNLLWVVQPHFQGEELTVVSIAVVRTGSTHPHIVETFSFRGPACMQETMTLHRSSAATRVVVVLGGTEVICRTMTMPTGSADQLEMALRLQIENLRLGGSARWRTDGSLLPMVDPDAQRMALVVEWPMVKLPPEALRPLLDLPGVTFAPGIVGLAALATGALTLGAAESLTILLDRAGGSISIAFTNGIHSAFRVVREDGSDAEEWCVAVVRAVEETLILADVPEAASKSIGEAVTRAVAECCDGFIAPLAGGVDSGKALVSSAPSDDGWWNASGTVAGLVLALGGPLSRLCALQAQETVVHPGFFRQLAISAERPRFAAKLAVAAVLIIALLPPAVAGVRLLYLQWLLPEPEAYARILDRDDKQSAMYRDYERYAWPVAKLLGDVASTTPEGIEIEIITIGQNAPLTLAGTAKPRGGSANAADAILQMEEQMRASGVFDRVEKTWDPPNANGIVKFDLTATIIKPTLVPNYSDDQDFAKRTLRDRKYGTPTDTIDPASPIAESEPPRPGPTDHNSPDLVETTADSMAAAAAGAPSTADDPRSRRRPPSSAGATSEIARRGRPGAETPAPAVPEPLTGEHIAAMTQAEAREAATRVSTARGLASLDEATEARLKAEFYKLLDRARNP